jgi:hypothetical protein
VIDDELSATLEEVEQPGRAAGTIEDIVLVDHHHRQPTALRVQRIPMTAERLLPGEKILARHKPFRSRHDFRAIRRHGFLLSPVSRTGRLQIDISDRGESWVRCYPSGRRRRQNP